ncbi:MAG TPA: hypothetical protein VM513_10715 [Kofleriaceae bacterium]|nr:hypothetical protein [Kofleriaceae bacterium]
MSAAKPYKRSWKNLLINKKYQLRFTLFMVGISTLLMLGLGWWVMRVANETTMVAVGSVWGTRCPEVPAMLDVPEQTLPPAEPPAVPMQLDEPGKPAPPPPPPAEPASDEASAAAGSADEPAADAPPRRATITMGDSSLTLVKTVKKMPPDFGVKIVAYWTCKLRQAGKLEALEHGRLRILWVLIGTGLVLVLGLALYGLKMTHKVAGPLFKVSLYFAKMRDGRFDKVWNLRKGDQLVDFYEHFKTAHAGVVTMQKDDLARIAEVIAAAEAAGLGEHPSIVALRELQLKKENAIE